MIEYQTMIVLLSEKDKVEKNAVLKFANVVLENAIHRNIKRFL